MSLETVTQLCRKLNVNANWFVTGEGEMFLSKPVSAAGKIKEIQKRSCLTDAQAAQLLNVSIEEYTQAVSGEKQPDVHLLKNLKKCFNVSIDWLLSD